jgi:rubrerythrin
MTTLVGTQTSFIDAIQALVELDYDAIEAYQTAINRLESNMYKAQLTQFKEDHERHVSELSVALRQKGEKVPTGPGLKQLLTQGKVILATLAGDKAILRAMLSNEGDTNTAYQRMSEREDILPEFEIIVRSGLEDERRHKAWLESVIS